MKSPERIIIEKILKSNGLTIPKLGLRFDRVVLSVFEDLRTFSEQTLPAGKTLILTMTAPIRLVGKTVKAIEAKIEEDLTIDRRLTINGNKITVRIVKAKKGSPRFIGFVHNPTTKSKQLIEMALEWCR